MELHAEVDATEDIHQVPGTGSREPVLLLDGYTTPPNTANPTSSLHAITIPPEDTNHAVLLNQPPNVNKPVSMVPVTKATSGLLKAFIQFHPTLKRSKLKS